MHRRVGDLHFAYVADKEVVKGRAQWQNPVVKSRLGATQSSVADGGGDAISGRVAEGRSRVLAQELTGDEEKLQGYLVSGAKGREPKAWKQFKVPSHY